MARENRSRQAVLAAVKGHFEREGFAPSLQEIADATQFSLMTVHRALRMLAKLGLITRIPYKQRSIRLVERQAVTK